jgi:hypothetical protein
MVEMSEEGYKPKEIGETLGWNVNTVRSWLKKHREAAEEPATQDSAPTPDPGYSDGEISDSDFGPEPPTAQTAQSEPVKDGGIFSTDDDIFDGGEPGPRPVHELLDVTLERMGVTKEKRKNLVDMVRTTPQYSDPQGLFGFLTDMSVNGHKAKLIIEQVFGMKMFGSQAGVQNPAGPNFNMPMPGYQPVPTPINPNMPGYHQPPPQPPQWDPRTGQYVPHPPQYPIPPRPNGGLTQADLDRKLAEQRAADAEKKALEEKFDSFDAKFNQLANMIQSSGGGGTDYIEEVVSEKNPDGSVMKDPDTGEIIRKKVTRPAYQQSPDTAFAQQMMGEAFDMMKEQAATRPIGPDPEAERLKEDNRRLAADLKEQKLREDMAAQNAALRQQLAESQAATNATLRGLADNLGTPQGASDEVRVGLAKIDSQTQIIKQGAGQVHDTVKEGIGLLKEMVKTPPPEGRDKVDQWSEDDLDYINS